MKAASGDVVIAQAFSGYDGDGVGMISAFVKNFERDAMSDAREEITTDAATYVATVQSESPQDPLALILQKISNAQRSIVHIIASRVSAIRGYFSEIFVSISHQSTLCVGEAGNETCLTKTELDSLLSKNNAQSNNDQAAPQASYVDEVPVLDEIPATDPTDEPAHEPVE